MAISAQNTKVGTSMLWSSDKQDPKRFLFALCFLALTLAGGCAMSAEVELNWEWPADRPIEQKLVVKVDTVKPQKPGLFGFKKSPSFAANLPEPTTVRGRVVQAGSALDGKTIEVVAPQLEIGDLKAGEYAVFGVVNSTTCVCIVPVNGPEADLSEVKCK